jgi:hypothetical protein
MLQFYGTHTDPVSKFRTRKNQNLHPLEIRPLPKVCKHVPMASVTAFLVLGTPHPNDIGISPEWVIELWEGNVATLKLKSANGKKRARIFRLENPKDIFKTVVNVLEDVYPDSTKRVNTSCNKGITVICLKNSSLERDLGNFKKLTRFDLHLATRVETRTYSHWSGEWV